MLPSQAHQPPGSPAYLVGNLAKWAKTVEFYKLLSTRPNKTRWRGREDRLTVTTASRHIWRGLLTLLAHFLG
jgi:hypothetical protein